MNLEQIKKEIETMPGLKLVTTQDKVVYRRDQDGQLYDPNEYLKRSDVLELFI